jgi:hypothetical protein
MSRMTFHYESILFRSIFLYKTVPLILKKLILKICATYAITFSVVATKDMLKDLREEMKSVILIIN